MEDEVVLMPGDELQRAADALDEEVRNALGVDTAALGHHYAVLATPVTDASNNLVAMTTSGSSSLPWFTTLDIPMTVTTGPLAVEWHLDADTGCWSAYVDGRSQYQELPTSPSYDPTVPPPMDVADGDDGRSLAFTGCTCEHLTWEHHWDGCEVGECECAGGWVR